MTLKLTYQYQIKLSLANRGENIEKISKEIEWSVKEFNIRSRVSKNLKQIVKHEINGKENLLYIWLNSNIEMNSPMRGLSLFSKLIIEQLDNGDKEKKELLNNIIRNKCFFRLAEEPKEVKNLKLERLEEIEEVQETTSLKKDVAVEEIKESNDLGAIKQLCKEEINFLMDFLISSEISEDDRKKIEDIGKLLKGLEKNE